MVVFFLTDPYANERSYMEKCAYDQIAFHSDERCDYKCFEKNCEAEMFIKTCPDVSIAAVDVTDNSGLELAKSIRKKFRSAFLILIADSSISPQKYLTPSVMAGGLILRPLSKASVDEVFSESFTSYFNAFYEDEQNDFLIKSREGRILVSYDRINYFESANKRIFLNADGESYFFYDTIDNLAQTLPEGFIRCHRSFIVNSQKVKKVCLSENILYLQNNDIVPMSRGYKANLKERFG